MLIRTITRGSAIEKNMDMLYAYVQSVIIILKMQTLYNRSERIFLNDIDDDISIEKLRNTNDTTLTNVAKTIIPYIKNYEMLIQPT